MANAKITAPASPRKARSERSTELSAKGDKRTAKETAELVDLLVARVEALEADRT